MSIILYHATSPEASALIKEHGFRDGEGGYGMVGEWFTGVFLSDLPLGSDEGTYGSTTFRVALDLPESAVAEYEWIQEESPYREWCIPAAIINEHGRVELLSDDELETASEEGWRVRRARAGLP